MILILLLVVEYIRIPSLIAFDPINDRQPPLMTCGEYVSDEWLEVRFSFDEGGMVETQSAVRPPHAPNWGDCSSLATRPQYVTCQEGSAVFVSDTPDTSWPTDCSPYR